MKNEIEMERTLLKTEETLNTAYATLKKVSLALGSFEADSDCIGFIESDIGVLNAWESSIGCIVLAMNNVFAFLRHIKKKRKEKNTRTKYSFTICQITEEDGTVQWVCKVPELKGCVGVGDTREEAIYEAQRNKEIWLRVAEEGGIETP